MPSGIGNTMSVDVVAPDAVQRDRAWWARVFAIVDAGDANAFVDLLTADAQFQFGNVPVITGRDAIRAAAVGFFAAIGSSRHGVLKIWNEARTAVCEGEVTYTRHDGSVLRVPFANVFEMRGDKIAAYRIYVDNSSLFGHHA
jgi:ketosteroid isomerase-like protein